MYVEVCKIVSNLPREQALQRVCHLLRIPNTATRSGLRRIHPQLHVFSNTLLCLYDQAVDWEEWEVCDTVGSIWTIMMFCADAVLCLALMKDGVLLRLLHQANKILPTVVLPFLALLARYGDDADRTAIIRSLTALLQVGWDPSLSYHPENVEPFLVTLCHCIGIADFWDVATAEPRLPEGLSVTFIAEVALSALAKPDASYGLIIHALPILIVCAKSSPPEETMLPTRILQFLASLLQSNDIALRSVAVWVFYGILDVGRGSTPRCVSSRGTVELLPSTAQVALWDAPPDHVRTYTLMLRNILWQVSIDGDYYKVAVGMAHVLLNGPFVFTEDDFREFKEGSVTLAGHDSWFSLLPEAVEAIKGREDPSHRNMADVLTLEHLARVGTSDAAATFARAVLERNPGHAYAYVTLCEHSADREEALQVARKGLRLPHLTRIPEAATVCFCYRAVFGQGAKTPSPVSAFGLALRTAGGPRLRRRTV
ncbi:hypothetical protein L227DRAFT_258741 [Lentinus tigrinus ALCF2SS1-6]|uniref:Uncharacterized protein n=1 Tax=Lentinus tigrinus ALCF2SS1-6 TaxID=1328759 RepID=A0A5C2RZH0_9APHY|nr:hypothetical protein L227DRAFT_258741 [Lentinus tigrinus ALCF2SS1-6]